MADSLVKRIAQVGAKVEGTKGTAETITASEATLLAYDPVLSPENEQFKRNPVVKHMSRFNSEPGARKNSMNFKAELMAPASKGIATPLSPILASCGFGETLTCGTSNVYAPISSGFSTCTLKHFIDGYYHTMSGAAGNVKFQCKVGEPIFCEFDMQGKYFAHGDSALLTPTYPSIVPFMFMGASITILGSTLTLENLEIDMQNEVIISPLPSDPSGIDFAKIVGRDPIMTFDPELVLMADHDFIGKLQSRATAAVTIGLNDSAGNYLSISMPAVRYTGLAPSDRSGIATYNATCEVCKNSDAGDDEITITMATSSSSSSSSSTSS